MKLSLSVLDGRVQVYSSSSIWKCFAMNLVGPTYVLINSLHNMAADATSGGVVDAFEANKNKFPLSFL